MKLQESDDVIVVSSNIKSNNFVIEAGAHAFAVLSDGLYSNKIQSIIRELMCNAYDAHVMVNSDRSIDLHLPTKKSDIFYVRDYGPGLSEEEIIGYTDADGDWIPGLYVSYFRSTKQNSNKAVGAFGLGSKSPFAYSKSFSVISFQNGVVKYYQCYIDGTGVPSVAKLGEDSTTEPNGLKIEFATNSNDVNTFEEEAKAALSYFPIKINMVGAKLSIPTVKYSVSGDGWGIRDDSSNGTSANAIVGIVPYYLHLDNLTKLSPGDISILKSKIDLFFKIGEVMPSPNRESLQYTDNLIDAIAQKISAIKKDINDRIKPSIDPNSWWNTGVKLGKLLADLPMLTNMASEVTVGNDVIDYTSDITFDVIPDTTLSYYSVKPEYYSTPISAMHRWSAGKTATIHTPLTLMKNMIIFINDTGKSNATYIKLNRAHLKLTNRHRIFIWSAGTKKAANIKNMAALQKEISEAMGNAPVVLMSSLPKQPTSQVFVGSQATGANKNTVFAIDKNGCMGTVPIPMPDGGIYIVRTGRIASPVFISDNKNFPYQKLKEMVVILNKQNKLDQLYAVTETQRKKLDPKKWKPVDKVVGSFDITQEPEFLQHVKNDVLEESRRLFGTYYVTPTAKEMLTLIKRVDTSLARQFADAKFHAVISHVLDHQKDVLAPYKAKFSAPLLQAVENLKKKYPLLTHDEMFRNTKLRDAYLNQIDQLTKD